MTTTGKHGKKVNASKGVQGFHEVERTESTKDFSASLGGGLTDEQAEAMIVEFNKVVDTAKFLEERAAKGIERQAEWIKTNAAKPVEDMSTDGIAEMACKMARYRGEQRVYRAFLHDVNENEKTTQQALFRVTGLATMGPSNSSNLAYRADSIAHHEGMLEAFAEVSKLVAQQAKAKEKILEGDVDA